MRWEGSDHERGRQLGGPVRGLGEGVQRNKSVYDLLVLYLLLYATQFMVPTFAFALAI
jgi:hypothetical protein